MNLVDRLDFAKLYSASGQKKLKFVITEGLHHIIMFYSYESSHIYTHITMETTTSIL